MPFCPSFTGARLSRVLKAVHLQPTANPDNQAAYEMIGKLHERSLCQYYSNILSVSLLNVGLSMSGMGATDVGRCRCQPDRATSEHRAGMISGMTLPSPRSQYVSSY